jgi:hypothetical protein
MTERGEGKGQFPVLGSQFSVYGFRRRFSIAIDGAVLGRLFVSFQVWEKFSARLHRVRCSYILDT